VTAESMDRRARRLDRVVARLEGTIRLLLRRGTTETRRVSNGSAVEVSTSLRLRTPEVRRLRQWCVATPGVELQWRDPHRTIDESPRLQLRVVLSDGIVGPGCLRPFLLGLRQLETVRKLEIELDETNRGILALYRETQSQRLQAGEASRRLADLNRRKDQFLSMLAHELRNPLAAIRAATDELRQDDDADRGHLHQVLDRQGRLLHRLVDDLLDVSRMTRGRLVLSPRRVDVRAALSDALDTVAAAATRRRIQLDHQVPNEPAWVDGDADRLMQIAVNLLDNAIKYTPPGGAVEARIDLRPHEVQLSVADSGRGFPPAEAERLFELFVQEPGRDEAPQGLGLGLSLVRSFVRLHGGRVRAYSPGVGQGSSFVATLPRASGPASDVEARSTASGGFAEQSLLLVEDNDDLRTLLAGSLRRHFATVEEAASGPEAVEALARNPDVVILDLGLPGLDGFEVAQRARTAGSTARLVALTGHGSEDDRRRVMAAGFDHHLVKPLGALEIIEALSSTKSDLPAGPSPERAGG